MYAKSRKNQSKGLLPLMCIVAVYERTSVVEVIRRTLNARMSSVCCMLIRKFYPRSKDVMILETE